MLLRLFQKKKLKNLRRRLRIKSNQVRLFKKDDVIVDIFSVDNNKLTKQNFLVPFRDIYLG